MPAAKDPYESFEEKFAPDPNSGCYLWTARVDPKGYGWFRSRNNSDERLAHRWSWLLYRGAIPPGMHVLHKCDTPACVRPDHLFLGTNDDNVADKLAKGRQARGERHSFAKLTAVQVAAIRQDQRHCTVVAADYGVNDRTIRAIWNGESWKE